MAKLARIHKLMKSHWPKQTWDFPRVHNFNWGFGLTLENAARAHTIVPYVMQDNAVVDYETIKTNPLNADWSVYAEANCVKGSFVPVIQVGWQAYKPRADTEVIDLMFEEMTLGCAFLNRLDAFDQKTGDTIKSIIEMQDESTDEQAYPLWNGTKLFEGHGVLDAPSLIPGLSTNQQFEGVAWDREKFFDAHNYYSNKNMLKTVTGRLKAHHVVEPAMPHGQTIIRGGGTYSLPSACKSMNPYTFHGQLFSLPQVGDRTQLHLAADTTPIEHLTITGFCRFFEYNPSFNFAAS